MSVSSTLTDLPPPWNLKGQKLYLLLLSFCMVSVIPDIMWMGTVKFLVKYRKANVKLVSHLFGELKES